MIIDWHCNAGQKQNKKRKKHILSSCLSMHSHLTSFPTIQYISISQQFHLYPHIHKQEKISSSGDINRFKIDLNCNIKR